MGKTLREMTAEVRELNTAKGWRTGDNTVGDYVALLHSEITEMLEAYRDWRLASGTGPDRFGRTEASPDRDVRIPSKPEGVGSEAADVLIRTLDMYDAIELLVFDLDSELLDVAPFMEPLRAVAGGRELETFGDYVAWLHQHAAQTWLGVMGGPAMLRALVTVCEKFGIDLMAEYERKMAYNRTRPHRHGGKAM